ncbi:MAG TPA: PAS domain S-box protein [Chitinophagaceae bacterium]|nr:PAS domain S-box protein [Chitinophagaceae bacterium]
MNRSGNTRAIKPDHLSVIHKAPVVGNELFHLQDAVFQTDLQFNITGWNPVAEQMHGLKGAMGKNLFELVNFELVNESLEEMTIDLVTSRSWSGEMIFKRYDGLPIYFRSTANYILNENDKPVAIVFMNHNISDIKHKEKQMAETENEYAILVNTLFDGVVMVKADGKIGACNHRAIEILGIAEDELLGRLGASAKWNAVRADGTELPLHEFPSRITLETGEAQRNVVLGIEKPDGARVWLLINSQGITHPGESKPYAAVISISDITDKLKSEEALRKSNERFYYAGKLTSDAIWDVDLETNEIYRSEAFNSFSGYHRDETQPSLDWWFEKVHPEDRDRVRNKVNQTIAEGIDRWQDEYRFQCADGSYKYLLDSGIILYRHSKPIRIIGAIQDLTERKKLEARLIQEEIQKQKQLSQSSIAVQEAERNNISKELHDNVNQILMSAKMFMQTAQKNPDQAHDLLQKAIEYQGMALEEIRKISKSLNTSLIKTVGLKESVLDIVYNMKMLKNLDVQFSFPDDLEDNLSNDQKLMVYRIIQEQTSNIIKYAEAKVVQLLMEEENGMIRLLINDDGKGFDVEKKGKGIGFVNIFSRADAYNGTITILSSPGEGCTLELYFPLEAS